ncbi:NUDIX domain-containing protein [Candidatus Saccharibacteria bacterium]|nr:NUDIX domain-containing protein [Candidatus Saccharibacteria bacterium]
MAKKQSAGILLYKFDEGELKVLIVHPGGPFFVKKDNGNWSIPKGLYEDNEDPFTAAKREYEEEIGMPPPSEPYLELGEIKRKDGKTIHAWAAEGDVNENKVQSNAFEMEWPPKSGKMQEFPEIDKALWFDINTASSKLQPAQVEFLKRLAKQLNVNFTPKISQQGTLF